MTREDIYASIPHGNHVAFGVSGSGKGKNMKRLMIAAALAFGTAACGSAAAGPVTNHPPGWTAHPVGPFSPGDWICFGATCYHVDGQGHPYGSPMGQQQN